MMPFWMLIQESMDRSHFPRQTRQITGKLLNLEQARLRSLVDFSLCCLCGSETLDHFDQSRTMYQFAQITLTAFDILTIAGDRDSWLA